MIDDVIVRTRYGKVRGSREDGTARFLGIPYAAAPFSRQRFRRPTPPTNWEGIRNAVEFGPTAPAAPLPYTFTKEVYVDGEECLNLNVWTPDVAGRGLPVMVWLHGGGYVSGSSAQPIFDGTAFARRGVVLVSVNFRVGADGLAVLPEAPANRMLLDQVAALEWVQDNITAFGGAPDNVTLFGSSAGAGATLALVSMRTGLFRRAIVQSAAPAAAITLDDAHRITAEIAHMAGVAPTTDGLGALEPNVLADVVTRAYVRFTADPDPNLWGASAVASGMPLAPVVDGDVLSDNPFKRLLATADSSVDMMIGSNSDELLALVGTQVPFDLPLENLRALLAEQGIPPSSLEERLRTMPGATAGELYAAVLTDMIFREPQLQIARARTRPTFVYEFAWASPNPGVGAAHGIELGFVFGNLGLSALEGQTAPDELAERVQAAWVAFATHGNPGWSPYTAQNTSVQVFKGGS